MKKKFFCVLLVILFSFSFLYKDLNANATGIEALPFIVSTGWDSTVAAYGALKGFQYGLNSDTPEIVGDFTKPYTYPDASIAPLKPSWDSFAENFFVNSWSDLYPVYSEEDAKKAWELEKKSFDEKIGLGNIDMSSYLYNVLNQWLPSLVGTDYIVPKTENMEFTIDSLDFPIQVPITGAGQLKYATVPQPDNSASIVGVAVKPFSLNSSGVQEQIICIVYFSDGSVNSFKQYAFCDGESFDSNFGNGWGYSAPSSLQGFASYGTKSNGEIITDTNSVVVPGFEETTEAEIITQLPVGNPNDNDDKDNKKISVLPNVPSVVGNLNNLGNINNGQLPIKFPSPDQNGLIPSIPVVGNGGITVNIPITNNSFEVINNYDQHQEIYNNNYSYPTINYNYVNYYVNEGAITYEQFLQALQKYFNVIVYNNETNNYYPTTINNTTNNYYTIQEVIGNEIPPILPPSTISVIDRFPFSIPFDIYKLLCLFNTPAHFWEWDIPVPTFQNGGFSNENYHGEIGHIDFSSTMHISLEQWEPVALVLRTMFSVLWLLFLYFIFQKLVH